MKSFKIGDLNISLPIIQGGMGVGVSLSGLASAVANEGGVGVISVAGLGLLYKEKSKQYFEACIDGLKEEIQKARTKSKGIIGVNIMVAMSNFADMVKTSIAEKVDVIFSGAGLALDLPSFLTKGNQTKLVPIVSSARAFALICNKWQKNYDYLPDAVVVEGPKAGGHLGYKQTEIVDENYSLEQILPDVIKYAKEVELRTGKKIPVIAAGGIYTGKDIYDIMQLGVDGVQMGSKFVTTDECDADIEFKKAYLKSNSKDIVLIDSPVGLPGRAILGEFINRVKQGLTIPKTCPFHCIKTCDYTKSPYCIMIALYNAGKGNLKRGFVFAGSKAYLAEKIVSVKETISKLKKEYLREVK